jgi:hypothetical protein
MMKVSKMVFGILESLVGSFAKEANKKAKITL